MTHKKAHPHRKARPADASAAVSGGDENSAGDADSGQIVERPDGYYWLASDGQAEFGPFESDELARADRDAAGDEPVEGSETLRQAEREIGINEWIDVETGEPAEGQSPPHLEEE